VAHSEFTPRKLYVPVNVSGDEDPASGSTVTQGLHSSEVV